MRKWNLTRILACLFVLGGIVRVFATRKLFVAFGIGGLWVDHAYFIYIYKVLGAFVILTGLVLWPLAGEGGECRKSIRMMTWGMVIVGLVMLAAGLSVGLPPLFYLIDVAFAWIVALVLFARARRLNAASL
jgi:hypothetical protein